MLDILGVTFPFFAVVGIGYLAARTGFLPAAAVPGLNVFVLYFALTAMLFKLASETPLLQMVDPVVVGVWLLASLACLSLATAVGRRRGRSWLDSSFGGLVAVMPNSGFMGIPLLIALLGTAATGPIGATLLVDGIVVQSIAVALSHRGAPGLNALAQARGALVQVSRNPLPWALIIGALFGTTGLALPGPVDDVVTMLSTAASPVALFTIGAVLARAVADSPPGRVRTGIRAWGDVYLLSAVKLVAQPLAVWLLGEAAIRVGLPLDRFALTTLVLIAALPAAANVSMLAERLGADNGRVARVILVSTVLSFGTFTAVAALLV